MDYKLLVRKVIPTDKMKDKDISDTGKNLSFILFIWLESCSFFFPFFVGFQREKENEDLALFQPDAGLFWPTLYGALGTTLVIIIFGILYEYYRGSKRHTEDELKTYCKHKRRRRVLMLSSCKSSCWKLKISSNFVIYSPILIMKNRSSQLINKVAFWRCSVKRLFWNILSHLSYRPVGFFFYGNVTDVCLQLHRRKDSDVDILLWMLKFFKDLLCVKYVVYIFRKEHMLHLHFKPYRSFT